MIPEPAWLVDQMTGVIDGGVDLEIFSFINGSHGHVSDKTKEYKLLDRTIHLDMPVSKIKRVIWALPLLLKILFFRPFILFKVFNFRRYGREALSLKYLFWVAPCLGKLEKYKVIHCHMGMIANKFFIIKEILNLDSKVIVTFYGQDSSKYIKNKGISAYDRLKSQSSYILTMTQEMRERFIKLGFPVEKLLVHYTAIKPDNYSFQQKFYKRHDCLKIVSVGRFVEKKGFDDLLRAVKIVIEKYKNIELNIIGGGDDIEYNNNIYKIAKDLGLDNYVNFKGLLPHKEILEFFKESHLMVQLSKTASDGDTDDLPFILLEGQISGLPIVTTNHVGIPEGVSNGVTGFVVREGDYREAARKILFFIENPHSVEEFSCNAYKFIFENFKFDEFNKKVINLYKFLAIK